MYVCMRVHVFERSGRCNLLHLHHLDVYFYNGRSLPKSDLAVLLTRDTNADVIRLQLSAQTELPSSQELMEI